MIRARFGVMAAGGFLAAVLSGQTTVADLPFDASADFLKLPDNIHLGEVAGVATNSHGHLFVYTRTGQPTVGLANSRLFTHGGSRLFEFDQLGRFVREIGQGIYSFLLAHSVRVDAQDNIWIVDEAANQVLKFSPEGRVTMVLGRKPEAIAIRQPPTPDAARGGAPGGGGGGRGGRAGAGAAGDVFTRPSDVAWDADGDIFVADGHGPNARVVKLDKHGRFLASFGARGSEPGQFNTPHSIAVDARNNVYVADSGNKRIQIFDADGAFTSQISGIGVPLAICISPGAHQYLYSAHAGDPYGMEDAAIYKIDLDGRVVGKFGRAGKEVKEFGLVNAIDCRRENELIVGELTNWRVQKLTLRPRVP